MHSGYTSYRSVGTATAAFVIAMLEGSTRPGVWFPEEVCRPCDHGVMENKYMLIYIWYTSG